jgi:hypothetical protein
MPADPEGVAFFSSSGEGLECVEIARKILASRLAFDACAVPTSGSASVQVVSQGIQSGAPMTPSNR